MQRAVRSDEVTDAVQRRGEAKGLALGFVGVAIFGLTLPMMRIALTGLDPIFVGLGRAILAAVVAALVLAGTRQPFPSRETWPRLVVISLGVIFGFPLLATLAMQYVPSAHGGVVLAVLPLATAMAGAAFAGERPSLGFWLTGIAGSAAVLAFSVIEAGGVTAVGWGDLLLIASVICAAIGLCPERRPGAPDRWLAGGLRGVGIVESGRDPHHVPPVRADQLECAVAVLGRLSLSRVDEPVFRLLLLESGHGTGGRRQDRAIAAASAFCDACRVCAGAS
jgi:hypothetical protein